MRPSTQDGSSFLFNQPAEAAVADVNAAGISSTTDPFKAVSDVSAESNTLIADMGSEQVQELETLLHDTLPAVQGDIDDEYVAHRKLLQTNRLLAAAARHANRNSSGSSEGLVRLKPNEKLNGMIASSSRAFGKPGK